MTEALTRKEATAFDEYEAVIDRGLKTFAEVGNALLAIRDARLYRDEYGTFEAYCKERWGMTRRRANQLVGAAGVMENLGTIVPKPDAHTGAIDCIVAAYPELPATESQARPLAKLPPEQQPEAWQAATDKAASEGRKVTARDVETEVETRAMKTTEVMTDPLSGRVDIEDIDPDEDRTSEPPNLAGLKRYWNYANKKERKAFLQWTQEEGSK